MKKLFLACCIEALLVLTITKSSIAQNLNSTVKPDSQSFSEKPTSSSLEKNAISDSGTLRLNERNSNAVRNFAREFGNVLDAKWFKSVNGLYVANFTRDQVQTQVCYNEKGTYEYMIRNYGEENLLPEVRHIVKRAYYDYSIFAINEVTINEMIIYVITLKYKSSWKVIQVVDGEMEIMKEYFQK